MRRNRHLSRHALILTALLLALPAAGPALAAGLTSVKITESKELPQLQPGWPVPSEPYQLFYVQRSTNSNTIVYTANFDENGNLGQRDPVRVFWRRYNTTGERKALNFVETQFAFGVTARPTGAAGVYDVALKAKPEISMQLRQTGPGTVELWARIGGRIVRPDYAYVGVDETGFIPRVVSLSLFGRDPATGRAITEYFSVSGGAIIH